jgi:hypothetical protein
MNTNFVSVNTDYQSRPGAQYARVARGNAGNARPFREYLSDANQAIVAASYDKQAQVAVCSVCMNWLENKRTMSEKPKNSAAIKPVTIVSGYYKAEEY